MSRGFATFRVPFPGVPSQNTFAEATCCSKGSESVHVEPWRRLALGGESAFSTLVAEGLLGIGGMLEGVEGWWGTSGRLDKDEDGGGQEGNSRDG